MNGLGEFIRGMTIWNWLALIAFIFFPLSALNAFFSLRSRFLDWRGIQDKKKFQARLKDFAWQLIMLDLYRDRNSHVRLFQDFLSILTSLITAAIFFIISTALGVREFAIITMVPLFYAFLSTRRLTGILKKLIYPRLFAEQIIDFIRQGREKGLIAQDSYLIQQLFDNEIFSRPDKEFLKTYAREAGITLREVGINEKH